MSEKEAQESAVQSLDAEGDACAVPASSATGQMEEVVKSESAPPVKELPVNTCSLCGKLKPGEEVWQCTLCLQNFCVNHLEPRLHYCYSGQST